MNNSNAKGLKNKFRLTVLLISILLLYSKNKVQISKLTIFSCHSDITLPFNY